MKLASFFTKITANDGSERTICTDDAPEWLTEAIEDAHQGDLPNDWIYDECRAACEAIDEGSLTDDDSVHEHADCRVEIYTKPLFQWAADMCLSSTYSHAEEEANDIIDHNADGDTVKRFTAIQYCAIATIARVILSAHQLT